MRRRGIEEELIALSTGTAETDDEEVLAARALFKELNDKYKEEIAPEAERVKAAGGLYILGTERHESRRIDNQLRGRSGRQGDPGESRFFISFEDDLIRLFGNPGAFAMLTRMGDEDTPLEARMLSNLIENAQKRIEADNFEHRKHVLNYDDVMNQQRKIIYNQRREVLDGVELKATLLRMIDDCIEDALASFLAAETPEEWNLDGLRTHFMGYLANEDSFRYDEAALASLSREQVREEIEAFAHARYEAQEALFTADAFREVERVILLKNVDSKWMDHIDMMDDLKGTVGLNAYAQRNPLVEYRIVGADMFDEMVADIRESTVRGVLTVQPTPKPVERVQVAKPLIEGFAGGKAPKEAKSATVVKNAKDSVGRNDPCPCGSGKKYKKCCGANQND